MNAVGYEINTFFYRRFLLYFYKHCMKSFSCFRYQEEDAITVLLKGPNAES